METTERSRATEILARPRGRGLLGNVRPSSRLYWLRLLSQNRVAVSSALFIVIVIVLAVGAPLVTSHDPQEVAPIDRLTPP